MIVQVQTATQVLQVVYLGNTGFCFPVANYPTREVDPSTLYLKFWEMEMGNKSNRGNKGNRATRATLATRATGATGQHRQQG